MNQLLFDRSTGNLGPQTFARTQTSHLLHAIQPAQRLRFNGGEKEVQPVDDDGEAIENPVGPPVETKIWAHQAGVNALAIDVENRMYDQNVTGRIDMLTTTVSYLEGQTLQ
jgi:DNA excision repair protein ERCC-8